MGANEFFTKGLGKTVFEAFQAARDKAQYDHGHAGYTGTLAEKTDYTVINVPPGEDPQRFAEKLLADDDNRICDKWGPAGAVKLKDGEWLFFGWASS